MYSSATLLFDVNANSGFDFNVLVVGSASSEEGGTDDAWVNDSEETGMGMTSSGAAPR